jgi:hypothetical protein
MAAFDRAGDVWTDASGLVLIALNVENSSLVVLHTLPC